MKTLKIFISLFCLSLLSACISSKVEVKVIDANTKEAISDAYVYIGDNLHLSDTNGKVQAQVDGNYIFTYAGKEDYFFAIKRISAGAAPKKNGVIPSTVELYPLPNYPKRLHRAFHFSPSKYFSESHIENTPNMKEFLKYLLEQNVDVYNFSAKPNLKNFILNVRAYETKEPLANCYVLISKNASFFSPQKDYLYMTNAEGYVDIPIKDYDKIFLLKEGYRYFSINLLKDDNLMKERTINLSLASKDKFPQYLKDGCLKISDKLLDEYPTNKMLQGFLAYLNKIDVIVARLPENEIVEIDTLQK